jgi:hypothetical protein
LLRSPEEQVHGCDRYARAFAESNFLQQVRTALRAESETRIEDLARGLDLRAAELAEQRAEHGRKARGGDIGDPSRLAEIKTRQAQLQEQRAAILLREQRRPDLLDIVSFERVAVGLVMPDDSPEAQEAYDHNIEAIALRVARNFEADRFNARVIDVSAPHLAKGYDLESHRANGEIVAIEVKGRANRGSIQLTENLWRQTSVASANLLSLQPFPRRCKSSLYQSQPTTILRILDFSVPAVTSTWVIRYNRDYRGAVESLLYQGGPCSLPTKHARPSRGFSVVDRSRILMRCSPCSRRSRG